MHPKKREQKQEFLMNNIVIPGYNKEQFVSYISEEKENGGDIDSWTLDELKKIVHEFQSSYKVPLTPEKYEQDSFEYDNTSESSEIFREKAHLDQQTQDVKSDEGYLDEYDYINLSSEDKENISDEVSKSQEGKGIEVIKASRCDFEDTTRISDLTALNKVSDHCIEITEALYNPGGLFSFSYIEYYVDTQPFGWNVSRREQDFKRLRNYLIK